jgi:sterol desaturase/sphingolipid hydroxylase (fatty acid hydroxylase superfamily)
VVFTPVALGVHYYVICTWVFMRQFEASLAHAGYELPGNPLHWIPGYAGEAYHDFHHSRYTGNYAVYTTLWDRVFGTYSRDYPEFVAQWKTHGKRNPADVVLSAVRSQGKPSNLNDRDIIDAEDSVY